MIVKPSLPVTGQEIKMNTAFRDAATTDPAGHGLRPQAVRRQSPLFWRVVKPLASLQLTVILFLLGVGLVFFGTLAQKTLGIWTVVDRYFWSMFVMVDGQPIFEFAKTFLSLSPDAVAPSWFTFPYPAGQLIGGLMFINLLAAHALRFRLTWKRSGIFILHGGMLLLFVGEFITREFQVEQRMVIAKGDTVNFAVDSRNFELAFVDRSSPTSDRVVVVPVSRVQKAAEQGQRLKDDQLPVDLEVIRYHINSRPVKVSEMTDNPATAGVGVGFGIKAASEVPGVDMTKEIDVPACYVRFFRKGTEEQLGTYLLTLWIDDQQVVWNDKPFAISLRNIHYYKPFSLRLEEFRFDRYPGTETAKNFSSRLTLVDEEKGQNREVLIKMNTPLSHRGETFYQADFDKATEQTTVLQVVRNPGEDLPYWSCGMVSGGMIIHFLIGLIGFLNRKINGGHAGPARRPEVSDDDVGSTSPSRSRNLILWIPIATVAMAGLLLAGQLSSRSAEGLDPRLVGQIPVYEGGRIKPLDTVARVDLRRISAKEDYNDQDRRSQPAIRWYLDTASAPSIDSEPASTNKVFRIDNDQLLAQLGLSFADSDNWRFSHSQIWAKRAALRDAVMKALPRPEKEREVYEHKVLDLWKRLGQFEDVSVGRGILLYPPRSAAEKWSNPADTIKLAEKVVLDELSSRGMPFSSLDEARKAFAKEKNDELSQLLLERIDTRLQEVARTDPAHAAWSDVLDAYRANNPGAYLESLKKFQELQAAHVSSSDRAKVMFEAWLNEKALYYHCTWLYPTAAIFAAAGFVTLIFGNMRLSNSFRWSALALLVLTLGIHTFTLISRMYLMDRWMVFVTNLYSSAVFIGWAAVILCLLIEFVYPLGIGNLIAAILGFVTTVIAHNLATSSDTLEMMQAVLDTNFWLATHVTTVTLGYSATYIAGLVGLLYIVIGVFTPVLREQVEKNGARPLELGRVLGQVIYGIVCVATLLSFVGTVLGGIWADYSWGRFWGWDPKENGAVLIVLWNALILHARWCGLVKDRGMAVLALVGNMITTWSWFGTNQLGVGLHNYGFSKTLANGCTITWVLHLGIICVGMIPTRFWFSYSTKLPSGNNPTTHEGLPVARRVDV